MLEIHVAYDRAHFEPLRLMQNFIICVIFNKLYNNSCMHVFIIHVNGAIKSLVNVSSERWKLVKKSKLIESREVH